MSYTLQHQNLPQQQSSSKKNQLDFSNNQTISSQGNGNGIQLPTKIHYHSRQNSPTDLSSLLIYNSKAENQLTNNNNLYEYTESNYNPLQDSPFINFSQLEPTPGSSGMKSMSKTNGRTMDPIYKGYQTDLKLDQSDKKQHYNPQGQLNSNNSALKPNIFVTEDYMQNNPNKLNKTASNKEPDAASQQIQSYMISPNSIKQQPMSSGIDDKFYLAATPNDKHKMQLPDERRILDFSSGKADGKSSTAKQITQIRSPVLAHKTKPMMGINPSPNSKTHQSEQSDQKQNISNISQNNGGGNQTFEDTPEILKVNKNILQPQYPISYSATGISLNNPASIKIKKPSPKNKNAQGVQNFYSNNNPTNDNPRYQSLSNIMQPQKSSPKINDFGSLSPIQPVLNNNKSQQQDNRYNSANKYPNDKSYNFSNNNNSNLNNNSSMINPSKNNLSVQQPPESSLKKQAPTQPTQDIYSLHYIHLPQQQNAQVQNKMQPSQSHHQPSSSISSYQKPQRSEFGQSDSKQQQPSQQKTANSSGIKKSSGYEDDEEHIVHSKKSNPISTSKDPQNNFYDSRNFKDPKNNYYDSRQALPSNDNSHNINQSVLNSDQFKLNFQKHTPTRKANGVGQGVVTPGGNSTVVVGSHHHPHQIINPNQQDIQKMYEFPKKKRELLEQQRQLLQQEREILEKEKELIEIEEEIFYETSAGHLSPQRSSHNPLSTNATPNDQRVQSFLKTIPVNDNNQSIEAFNHNQYPQNSESIKHSKKSQQNQQPYSESLTQLQQAYENAFDQRIRESQHINSEYKLNFLQPTQIPEEASKHTPNSKENGAKKSAQFVDKKQTTPVYYTLNSLHGSKQSQNQNSQFLNPDKGIKDSTEQNFQRQKGDLEQSFHTNIHEDRNVKDIITYFKEEQDKQYNPVSPMQNYSESSNSKNKIIQLPYQKKELSEKNRQPQITNQSPDKTEDQIVYELVTPQKDYNKNHYQRELNQFNKSPGIQLDNDFSSNNPNTYLVKKPKIFSPMHNNYRSMTPQTNFLSRNAKPKAINYNQHEFGIQVDDNSFNDRASFLTKNSPSSDNHTKKTMNNSELRSVAYPLGLNNDRGSIAQGQSNVSSPAIKLYPTYANDVSTNDYAESQLISNKQSLQKPDFFQTEKNRSISNPPQANPQQQSIEYVYQNRINNQGARKIQKENTLCFGCGDTQMSSENNIILDSYQYNNNPHQTDQNHQNLQNQQQAPPPPQSQKQQEYPQHQTFQTLPQEMQQLSQNNPKHPPQQYSSFIQNNQNNQNQPEISQIFQQQPPSNVQSVQSAPFQLNSNMEDEVNQNPVNTQPPPRLMTQLTFNQDSIRSPYFKDEREDQIKRAGISPQRIFNTLPNTTKSGLQFSVEKVSYDPNDYKNNNNLKGDQLKQVLSSSFYPINNQKIDTQPKDYERSPNISGIGSKPVNKQQSTGNIFRSPISNQNSFVSNMRQQQNAQKYNDQIDFSYLNTSNNNISGVFHQDSQEIFCDKCLEFITGTRFDTHYNVCQEMNQFKSMDNKRQMDQINQKILKVAYLVKRKNLSTSPIRGGNGIGQTSSTQIANTNNMPNNRQLANPKNLSQQQSQQRDNNNSDQAKLNNYCSYMNGCLSDLSHKTISYQDFLQGEEDLKLIIQRIKSVKDNHNMSYYGEKALEILDKKKSLMKQNPI